MRDSEKEVQHTSVAAVVSTTSSIAKKRQIRFHTAVMREALDGCRRESDNEECEGVKRPTLIVVCAAGGLRDSEECEGVMCPTLRVIDGAVGASVVLWSGTNKNRDVSTGPLARPLTRGKVIFLCPKMTWFCPIVPSPVVQKKEPMKLDAFTFSLFSSQFPFH